ncbi:MAG: DUF4304 domain-containing protein [Terracidiphilus sp.]
MEDLDRHFLDVLKGLRTALKENGFRSSSQNFISESPDCWAVINLQKSRWSQPGEKTFYVNVAVTAKRLMTFDDEPADRPPAYWKCIWNNRAEQFGPEPNVQQWTIRDDQTAAKALVYIKKLICDFVIPSIKPRMSEVALLRAWANDRNLGYQQLKAKSVLLAASGDTTNLRVSVQVLTETFGGGGVAEGVRNHIKKLRTKFPAAMEEIDD